MGKHATRPTRAFLLTLALSPAEPKVVPFSVEQETLVKSGLGLVGLLVVQLLVVSYFFVVSSL